MPLGLATVSTHTATVSGPAAALTASGVGGTTFTVTPQGWSTFLATPSVP